MRAVAAGGVIALVKHSNTRIMLTAHMNGVRDSFKSRRAVKDESIAGRQQRTRSIQSTKRSVYALQRDVVAGMLNHRKQT